MATHPDDRRVWVLDTETKGTGAHIAPKRDDTRTGAPERPLALVDLHPTDSHAHAPSSAGPEHRSPLRFRVLDVMTSRVLAEDVSAREVIAALEQVRHAVDALVFVREPDRGRWRLLTVEERRHLWEYRGKLDGALHEPAAAGADR
jgi:hypothetical protein